MPERAEPRVCPALRDTAAQLPSANPCTWPRCPYRAPLRPPPRAIPPAPSEAGKKIPTSGPSPGFWPWPLPASVAMGGAEDRLSEILSLSFRILERFRGLEALAGEASGGKEAKKRSWRIYQRLENTLEVDPLCCKEENL